VCVCVPCTDVEVWWYRAEIEGTCVLAQKKKPSPYTRAKTTKYNKSRDYCLSPPPTTRLPTTRSPSQCTATKVTTANAFFFYSGINIRHTHTHTYIHILYVYIVHTHTRAYLHVYATAYDEFVSCYTYFSIRTIVSRCYTLLLPIIYILYARTHTHTLA